MSNLSSDPSGRPPAAAEPPPASRAPQRPTVRQLTALCAVLAVLVVALTALAGSRASALSDERGRRSAIEETARRFATALYTYDFRDLERSKLSVQALSTERFKRQYDRTFGGLQAILTETEAQSRATVTEVYLGDADDDTATVIVVADAISRTKAGTRRILATYIQVDLVKVGSSWRVNDVTNVSGGQEDGITTTTTAPEPTTTTRRRAGRR